MSFKILPWPIQDCGPYNVRTKPACLSRLLQLGWLGRGSLVVALLFLGRGAEIPGLDDIFLGGVDIFLSLDMANADAHTILCEYNVLLVHLLRRGVAHDADADVDLVGDPRAGGEEDEEDDEGEKLAEAGSHLGGLR
jgi:hypothetical protein